MSKRTKIEHQIKMELNKETKFGESKKAAKEAAHKLAKENNTPYVEPSGIYSTKTFSDYVGWGMTFVNYCITNHSDIRNLNDCKRYVEEYIKYCKDKELSSRTIHNYAYAIKSIYHANSIEDLGIEKVHRYRKDIKRCREAENNKLRQNERYQDVIKFLKATGCRRIEAMRLTKDHFREREDGNLEILKDGKGGIKRWCLVVPDKADFVREYVKNKETCTVAGQERLFKRKDIPKDLPVHDCRAYYASDLYNYFEEKGYSTGSIYYCRKDLAGYCYDNGILQEVTYHLQHGRSNIVIDYLWVDRN